MSLFDIFKKRGESKPTEGYAYAPTMNGGTPFYSSFGNNLYASDIIVQSIRCKANEFKKLQPRHIVTKDGKQSVRTDSSIAKVLRRPNPYMGTGELLEKCAILLELNKNVFIYPEYYKTKGGEKHYTALYPLKPSTVEYWVDASERYYLHFGFANGYQVTLPAEDVIHWRKDYGVNDYFGGSMFGGNDDRGLLRAVKEYDKLTQSIAKAVECSCQVNGIMRRNTYLDDEKILAEQQAFAERLANNQSSILFTDMKADYTHIPRDVKIVDSETLKFYYDVILRASGTSLAILNGDYTVEQKTAYYEHALEADIIGLGQAFTRCVFSDREESYGNEVTFYPNKTKFMTIDQAVAYMQVAVPAGALSVNQILELGGFPPVEGGDDIRPRGYNSLDGAGEDNNTSQGAE